MPLSPSILGALIDLVGASGLLTRSEDLIPYSFDGTAALRVRREAVILPRTTAQVAGCVRLAAHHGLPVVTRGSGTGLSGGSVPVTDGLVLCLAQMDAILGVDARNLTVRAQAGAVTEKIDHAAAAHRGFVGLQVGTFWPYG